jgi:hypothetical protein
MMRVDDILIDIRLPRVDRDCEAGHRGTIRHDRLRRGQVDTRHVHRKEHGDSPHHPLSRALRQRNHGEVRHSEQHTLQVAYGTPALPRWR